MLITTAPSELYDLRATAINPIQPYSEDWSGAEFPKIILDMEIRMVDVDVSNRYSRFNYSITVMSNDTIRAAITFTGDVSFGIPFERMNETKEYDGTSYHAWHYSRETRVLPLYRRNLEVAPFDYYEMPTILLAIDGKVFVRKVALKGEIQGYVISFKPIERPTAEKMYSWVAPNYDNYYGLVMIAVRSQGQLDLQLLYLLAMFNFVWLSALLSVFRITELKDRLKVMVGVTFAVFGFMWTFRGALSPTVTYWELALIYGIFVWFSFEYLR
jgi:hypothetical protein